MLIALIAVSIVLALAGHVIAGRLAGFSVTALCSATMAFFLMPPVFSFRVSKTQDIVVLAFYGATGLVLAKTAPKKKRTPLRVDPVCDHPQCERLETDLSPAVADLMASDLGVSLRAVNLAIFADALTLPCTKGETFRIMSDVITAAVHTPEVRCISIYGGHQPGVRRLVVTAHYVWPPPLLKVIPIGKRDDDCKPVNFPGWPLHSRASWFDNGYERIFQVSVEAN